MSIGMIAKDLYRLIREVVTLEGQIENAPAGEREQLRDRLRKIKAQRDQMRRMLEGCKDSPHK